MNCEKYIMSIDIGTQSVRALVFSAEGDEIANERIINDMYYSLEPGWAEVPAYDIWKSVCIVTNRVVEKLGKDIDKLKACSVTANRDNIIPLDEEGNYIRDWITWVDQRRVPEAIKDAATSIKGVNKVIHTFGEKTFNMLSDRSKFNWFKYHEKDTYERAYKYLTMGGLVTYKFTDQYHDSVGMQVGVLPFNIKTLDWFDLDIIYEIIGIRRDQLPKLFQAGKIMGHITEKASRETGLPIGLPIVAAGGDKQCETLGSGAFSEEQATISYGTLATLALTSKKYVGDRKYAYYTWPSTIPNAWNPEFSIDRGYWLVTWFCRQYALEEDYPVLLNQMNKKATDIPAGSNGLFVYPFWAPHYVLYPDARGAIIGWTDDHRKEHLYRAILESIAYALRDGLEIIEKKMKTKVKEIYVVGGGSKSDLAMQLTADIFNIKTIRLQTHEVCAAGAAIAAGVAVGLFENEKEGVNKIVRKERIFYPLKENRETYDDIYKNVYKKSYKNNQAVNLTLSKYLAARTK
ncbi:MAG: carbohydrate kinase [Tissierellia bacterium]|nr:carbohydrate kinase [Tissierellia bacterium]